MRSILAGLLLLLMSAPILAQSKGGEVESIGFGGYVRPDTWTPMVVRLRPGTLEPGYYQIQIEQKDLDEDTQVFTRTIQVNATEAAREQRFWMYFLPQTKDGGLPETSVRDLDAELKVWLCDKNGKQLEPLPITSTIRSIDTGRTISDRPLGRKFILCIGDGTSRPMFQEYSIHLGVTEDIAMVVIRPDELPESALGYDGVDAVVWMSGESDLLTRGGSRRLPALTEFVRLGGKLIVTQPAERGKVEALAPLLPIELKDAAGNWLIETRDRHTLLPLRNWIKPTIPDAEKAKNPWLPQRGRSFGPFKVARASAVKPGAMVVATIDWSIDDGPPSTQPAATDESPFLVRWGVGLGQVTWVAQNLGDQTITSRADRGWVGIWDKVLDLKNDPRALYPGMPGEIEARTRAEYAGGGTADLGYSLLDGMEHTARGTRLVALAIGFFILYWAVAGPISYLVLANKKKKGATWPIFAASAVVATLLTVLVVRLVMGADADIHHITFVRWAPNQPAVVDSRLGVYLTKSSDISIALKENDPAFVSYVSAFNPHPVFDKGAAGFVGKERYSVPLPESTAGEEIEIFVPFRSTLKKLQARWTGAMPGIEGSAKLVEATDTTPSLVSGRLTNSTGRDLRHVYICYTERRPNGEWVDHLCYVPKWDKEAALDLDRNIIAIRPRITVRQDSGEPNTALPGEGKVIVDTIPTRESAWVRFWNAGVRANAGSGGGIGSTYDQNYLRSFLLLSLFERLPVVKRTEQSGDRFDIQRRGSRKYDMSPAVGAGQLVILAQDAANDAGGKTQSTLPFPLEVDGDKIPGSGVTFYQFALPLTRTAPPPTTQQVEK